MKVLENGKISSGQFKILVLMFTVGTSIILGPSQLATQAKQDAWISAILGTCIGLVLVGLYNKLGKLFPTMTLVEYSEVILGKWPGKIISILFLTLPFTLAALILRNIGDFLTTQLIPETPIQAIHITFMGIVVMGTRLGLEVLARSAQILFPWFLALFIFLVVFASPDVEIQKILPILPERAAPVLYAAFPFVRFPFMELVILLMIFPFVSKPEQAGKAFLMGTFIGGMILVLLTALCLLVLGADFTGRQLYPSYTLAKTINIADFLQRIEAIVAGMWFITIFFKLAICFYASALGLGQILRLKEIRPLYLPLGMILVVYSLKVAPNITYNMTITSKAMTPHVVIFSFLLPLLLLGVAKLRKLKKN